MNLCLFALKRTSLLSFFSTLLFTKSVVSQMLAPWLRWTSARGVSLGATQTWTPNKWASRGRFSATLLNVARVLLGAWLVCHSIAVPHHLCHAPRMLGFDYVPRLVTSILETNNNQQDLHNEGHRGYASICWRSVALNLTFPERVTPPPP